MITSFRLTFWITCLVSIAFSTFGFSQSSEIKYLSGKGKGSQVYWNFEVTGGAKQGVRDSIKVPSNWEFEGFGNFNYGRDKNPSSESGLYSTIFMVPSGWKGKRIYIVFEAVMTDATVTINGQLAGKKHQGAFYRFSYDITDKIYFDKDNLLEVKVDKVSSNQSVNKAERKADYWIFGGIFRPVYLKAVPNTSIQRVAIDAEANGKFAMDVFVEGIKRKNTQIDLQIFNKASDELVATITKSLKANDTIHHITTSVKNPDLWTSETPNLYYAVVSLKNGKDTLHEITETFGFRTIRVKKGDGVYINGTKVLFKGVNRHSFHPNSGRTLSDSMNLADALLIKAMNMNTVRMSHYPPDKYFLKVCDSVGLYVFNELSGWHDAYDDTVGFQLVRELVTRDVNHPSIVFWDNGNEGGWNTNLDGEFAKYDPQNRPVLHPWALFNEINTDHYENYKEVDSIFRRGDIYMPTEFLHGLYDGGSGAALDDYWKLMLSYPHSAGGILWAFADEGVVRPNQNGKIDVDGNNAPDGIIGPFHEKEGSFYTIKEIWSPVQVKNE